MDHLLDEIEGALRAQLWLLAVTSTLLVPDIAAALSHPSGETKGTRYKAWWNAHLATAYDGYLSADDAWAFRCSLTHQGSAQHAKAVAGRILFLPPGPNFVHKIRMGGDRNAVALDLKAFVDDVVGIGRGWLNAHRHDPIVAKNLDRGVRLHPQGLAPFIVGTPLIG